MQDFRFFGKVPVSRLASAALPYGTKRRVAAVLRAYFDASGTHGSPILTVATYVSTDDQWDRFQREWRDFLDAAGVRVSHATDLESRQGEFKGWDRAKAVTFQKRLISTIKLRTQFRASVSVNVPDFDEIAGALKQVYTAYGFCVFQCFHYIAAWSDKYSIQEPIAYFFEQGDREGEIVRAMQFLERHEDLKARFRFFSYTFAPKNLEPLQAADMLAYETWKHVTNWNITPPGQRRPTRRSLDDLMGVAHSGTYYDRAKIIKWAKDFERFQTTGEI